MYPSVSFCIPLYSSDIQLEVLVGEILCWFKSSLPHSKKPLLRNNLARVSFYFGSRWKTRKFGVTPVVTPIPWKFLILRLYHKPMSILTAVNTNNSDRTALTIRRVRSVLSNRDIPKPKNAQVVRAEKLISVKARALPTR